MNDDDSTNVPGGDQWSAAAPCSRRGTPPPTFSPRKCPNCIEGIERLIPLCGALVPITCKVCKGTGRSAGRAEARGENVQGQAPADATPNTVE